MALLVLEGLQDSDTRSFEVCSPFGGGGYRAGRRWIRTKGFA